MIFRIFAVSLVALAIGAYVEGAYAGQYFVCENGETIGVEFSELEQMKRTNACVAKHYGIDLKSKVAAPEPSESQSVIAAVEAPVRKPVTPLLRKSQRAVRSLKPIAGRKIAGAVASNFRRVRIINAQPGANKWCHHTQ